MVERGGCTSGKKGYGSRKFNHVLYDVYKIYISEQLNCFDQELQENFLLENKEAMERDKLLLKIAGKKVRTICQDCGQIRILYIISNVG